MANIITQTENWSHADWTVNDATLTANSAAAPTFAGGSAGLADTLDDVSAVVNAEIREDKTITSDTSDWTASIYIKKDAITSRFPALQVRLQFGTPAEAFVTLNTSTGAISDCSGLPAGDAKGVVDVDANWWRLWIRKANNGTGNNGARLAFFPAMNASFGAGFSGPATGSIIVWGANLTNTSTLQDYEPDPYYAFGAGPPDLPIWQLTELTSPALADLLLAVDSPASSPITKKLALSDFATTLTLQNVVVQVKTVGSGTYTPTAGMKKVLGIAVGSGGGGAGGTNTDSAGGGGGGGGTVIRLMTAANIGASKAYVVGAGGAALNNGNPTTLDAAGALLNAGGGSTGVAGGASSGTIGTIALGGAGGTAANGDLNIPGQTGGKGIIYDGASGNGGQGGSSVFGFGALASPVNTAGAVGQAYGGGGGGGHASGTPNMVGAAGADGILFLLEFI